MTDEQVRPRPMVWKPIPTIWVDYTTGQGVRGDGARITPKVGQGRKNPNLTDMLDTAAAVGAERIMFTGKVPVPEQGTRHWLFVRTPNWKGGDVWTRAESPSAQFEHVLTGQKVRVRTAKEWFGDLPLSPDQARLASDALQAAVEAVEPRAGLMLSPARTGSNLWAWSVPKSVPLVPVSAEIAEELHRTSGQHHLEHLVAGPNFDFHPDCVPLFDPAKTPKIQEFTHVDGRFMYAGLGRELGVGPGVWLNQQQAEDLFHRDHYARARFEIRFTVPSDWEHVGLLPVAHERASDGWYYPNRPGAVGVTWADAFETFIAMGAGWHIEILRGLAFQKSTPLDTFMDRMQRARERVTANPDIPAWLKRAVTDALRQILITAIGNFASRGRDKLRVASSPMEVPAEYRSSVEVYGDVVTYKLPGDRQVDSGVYHPEIASQLWARGRCRVLWAPTADRKVMGGALSVPGNTLLGINGDALYTTACPWWSLPKEHGGVDDGKVGRLRIKSYMRGSFLTPDSIAARTKLRERADRLGPTGAYPTAEQA